MAKLIPETSDLTGIEAVLDVNLIQILHGFSGTDETRPEIVGVRVEPVAEGGVVMAALDGHNLLSIHHKGGSANRAFTLYSQTVDKVKCPARATTILMIADDRGQIYSSEEYFQLDPDLTELLMDAEFTQNIGRCCLKEAYKFPAWRGFYRRPDDRPNPKVTLFSGNALRRFGRAAAELSKAYRGSLDTLVFAPRVTADGQEKGCIVRFGKGIPAVGATMPMREGSAAEVNERPHADSAAILPSWC